MNEDDPSVSARVAVVPRPNVGEPDLLSTDTAPSTCPQECSVLGVDTRTIIMRYPNVALQLKPPDCLYSGVRLVVFTDVT